METFGGQAAVAILWALVKYIGFFLLGMAAVALIMFILGSIVWALMSLIDGGLGKTKGGRHSQARFTPNNNWSATGIGERMHVSLAGMRAAAQTPEAQARRSKFKESLSKLGQHMQKDSSSTSVSINTHHD